MTDHYQTLGIDKTANADEIKSAFRSLAKKYHPDKNLNDESATQKFQEINTAYQTLGDPAKRAAYDNPSSAQFGGFNVNGMDMGDIFSELFKQHHRQQQMQMYRVHVTLEEILNGKLFTLPNKEEISIPPGMPNGARLNMNTFLVQVIYVPHQRFHVDGNNLITPVKLPIFDALLGVDAEVLGLDGKKFAFKIPSCSNNGAVIRLAGQGLPLHHNPSFRGDLFIVCELEMPTVLTPEQQTAILAIHNQTTMEIT